MATEVVELGVKLVSRRAVRRQPSSRFGHRGVGVVQYLGFGNVDEPPQPVGILSVGVRQIVVEPAELGRRVQQRHIDARIVHLGDQQLCRGVSPVQHRRVVLLGVRLALVVPRDAVPVYRELNVVKLIRLRVDERRVVGGSAVTHPPHGLVVSAQLALEFEPFLLNRGVSRRLVSRWKAVCVTVDYHVRDTFLGGPNGIRIRVSGLKGQRPSPLDDGATSGPARV